MVTNLKSTKGLTMVIYIVGTVAFILGANIGVLLALLLLHGKAESLAARNARVADL